MDDYGKMTHDDFVRILQDILDDTPANHLLDIPGIWEVLAEHYNNDVLQRWEDEQDITNPVPDKEGEDAMS